MNFKHAWLSYTLSAVFCIGFVLAPYASESLILPRTEELNYSLYPLVLWSRQILSGGVPMWFPDAGLGIPWPIPHTMSHTPFSVFFSVLPVYKALAALLAVHIVFQAYFTVRVARYLGLSSLTTAAVLFSVLLAAPIEYLVPSDAAAVYLSWTLLPAALYAILRLLDPAPFLQSLGYAALLGAVVGYGILNGHAGVFSTHILGLALVAALQPQRLLYRWHFFLLAIVLALCIGSEKLYLLFRELPYFGETVRLQYTLGQPVGSVLWNIFLKPLVFPLDGGYLRALVERNAVSRTLTFGSPLCAILLLFGAVRFIKDGGAGANRPLERALWVALSACFVVQFVPTSFLPVFISASWTFRDPAILIGLLLAGCVCDRWLRNETRRAKVYALLSAHLMLLMVSAAVYTYGSNWRNPVVGASTALYDALGTPGEEFPLYKMIRENLACAGEASRCAELTRRVVYDGRAANAAHYGKQAETGLHLNALPLHELQEVSYLTKGLSLDAIHPSQSKPYGMITTLRFAGYTYRPRAFDWVRESPSLLDLLGIRIIVGMDDPIYESRGFERLGVLKPEGTSPDDVLVIYKNPRAFPQAFFVPLESLLKVRRSEGCPDRAAFLTCLDVSAIVRNLDPWRDPVHVEHRANGLTLSFAPSGERRQVLITSMFRPEWRVGGGELSSFHGLLRVTVPAGAESATLDYFPIRLILARTVSLTSLVVSILGLLAVFGLRHRALGNMES